MTKNHSSSIMSNILEEVESLIINIEELLIKGKEKSEFEEVIELRNDDFENLEFLSPVKANYIIEIYQEGVFLKGSYSVDTEILCVRCLEKFKESFSGDFERNFVDEESYKEYLEESTDNHNYNPELEEKDLLENNLIDTSKILKEVLVLDIPNYPICKEECKGLEGLNGYASDEVDPRWQELLNIMKDK